MLIQHADRDQPQRDLWLFPGRRAHQPLHPEHLAKLVHQLGVPTVAGRTAAFRQHVTEVPAPGVADALGYHQITAAKAATQAGTTWSRYAPGDHTVIFAAELAIVEYALSPAGDPMLHWGHPRRRRTRLRPADHPLASPTTQHSQPIQDRPRRAPTRPGLTRTPHPGGAARLSIRTRDAPPGTYRRMMGVCTESASL